MAGIRMHKKDDIHFITNRCEQEQFLMLPNEKITEIISCWFARALVLFGDGLEIYAFIFLSNHFHLLCKDKTGTLAAFMSYFQGNVARAINRELGRHGHFWHGKYDDMIVDGDDEFLDRYAYIACNAVKAGLVDNALDWKGFSSLPNALSGEGFSFDLLNKTKLHDATRRGQKVDRKKFIQTWEFQLSTPPMWADKTQSELKASIEELVKVGEKTYRVKRDNKPALGMKKVLMQKPTNRPADPVRRPRVRFFTFCDERRKELKTIYRNFVGKYMEAFDAFLKAAHKRRRPTVEWPTWSYPPSGRFPVGSAAVEMN